MPARRPVQSAVAAGCPTPALLAPAGHPKVATVSFLGMLIGKSTGNRARLGLEDERENHHADQHQQRRQSGGAWRADATAAHRPLRWRLRRAIARRLEGRFCRGAKEGKQTHGSGLCRSGAPGRAVAACGAAAASRPATHGAAHPPARHPPCRRSRTPGFYRRGRVGRRCAKALAVLCASTDAGESAPTQLPPPSLPQSPSAAICRCRPGKGRSGEVPGVHQRRDLAEDAGQVLVAMAPKTAWVRGKTHLVQVLGQRSHRMRVVRHVQHHHGLAGPRPGSGRQLDEAEPVRMAWRPPANAHARPQRRPTRRKRSATGSPQRWVGQAREAALAARPLPLLAVAIEVEVAAQLAQVGAQRAARAAMEAGAWGRCTPPVGQRAGCPPSRARPIRGPAPGTRCGRGQCW